MIIRDDMLELTRRMTSKRTHLTRLAGAYLDEEGYVEGNFNTNFMKLAGAEKQHCIDIAKTVPFAETNVELKEYRLTAGSLTQEGIWQLFHALRDCDLKNDALLLNLYEILGERLPKGEPHAVYLYEGIFDIPRKGHDREYQGESEEVYKYLLLALCPLRGEYDADLPDAGLIWPAYKNHGAALNYVDIYQKKGTAGFAEILSFS